MGFTPEIGSSVPKFIEIRPLFSHQAPVSWLFGKLRYAPLPITAAGPATNMVKKNRHEQDNACTAYYTC